MKILIFIFIIFCSGYICSFPSTPGTKYDNPVEKDTLIKGSTGNNRKENNDENERGGGVKTVNCTVLSVYDHYEWNDISVYGDEIVVDVNNLDSLKQTAERTNKKIVLFLNGVEMKGIYGKAGRDSTGLKEILLFKLNRNSLTNNSWAELIERNDFNLLGINILKLSAGLEGDRELLTNVNEFRFSTMRKSQFWILASIILLAFCLPLFVLAKKSEILCEPDIPDSKNKNRPYSLALTQMAFWYTLIMSSIIFLYMINKEAPVLNKTALVLMGISTITGIVASSLNKNKKVESNNKLLNLENEKIVLENRLDEIESGLAEEHTTRYTEELKKEKTKSRDRLIEVQQLIKTAETVNPIDVHKSFWKDLLSDSSGISLHRFQILGWTLALGVLYVIMVLKNFVLPEFDDTLLALMGISSGAYIGFKFPELKDSK